MPKRRDFEGEAGWLDYESQGVDSIPARLARDYGQVPDYGLTRDPRRRPVHEPAGGPDLEHERWRSRGCERDAVDLDRASRVDRDPRPVSSGIGGSGAGDDGEAEVDAVAVEDAREAPADDAADPAALHRQRNMLPR